MNRRELLPRFRNEALEMIQAEGLDWEEFEWTLTKGPWAFFQVSLVTHKRTGVFFLFDCGSNNEYYPKAWPGGEWKDVDGPNTMRYFQFWVKRIAPEIKAPDLWALAAQQKRIGTDPQGANTPFSKDEQLRIGDGLRQLEAYVFEAEPTLSVEKRQAVSARFAYLKERAARLGRIDWMSLVVGQLFGMASEKIITVQTFTSLYTMAAGLLHNALAIGSAVLRLTGL